MSQRGGSVVTHVRFGDVVHSPVIEHGTADALVGFELLEAARHAPSVRSGGLLIANTHRILPLPVLTGSVKYPNNLEATLSALPLQCLFLDAHRHAEALGQIRTVNTLLLGVLARHISTELELWAEALRQSVSSDTIRINLTAFNSGWSLFDTSNIIEHNISREKAQP